MAIARHEQHKERHPLRTSKPVAIALCSVDGLNRSRSHDADDVDLHALKGTNGVSLHDRNKGNVAATSSEPQDKPIQFHLETKTEHSLRTRIIACLQYGLLSICLTLFNRAVFSVYKFNFPSLVTLAQILLSIVYMYMLNWCGWVELGMLSAGKAKQVAPLALFWWLYVISGVTALRYLNVPMVSALRRITTLPVAGGEYYLFGRRPSRQLLAVLLLMVGGPVGAAFTDLNFNFLGYTWVSICVVSTAIYLLLIKKLHHVTGLDEINLLLYNTLLALPLMLVHLLLATNELQEVRLYPDLMDTHFQLFFLVSCSLAFMLNLCIFRCTIVMSPLGGCVTGQMKDILTTVLGMVLFSDTQYTALNLGGIFLGLLGSVAYSTIKYLES